jgi:signal transduction histidine kinase
MPSGTEVIFEVAERDGRVLSPFRAPLRSLPAWWGAVSRGKLASVSSAEERAAHPQYCVAGWGGDQAVQSLLAAPLVRGTALLGAIVAASPRSDVYAPEQTQLFEALARTTVTALDETQRSTAQMRSEPLAVLINAVLSLNVSLDLKQTVQTLARLAAQVTAAQAAAVFLLDEHSRYLVAQARSQRGPASLVEELPAGEVRLPIAWRDLETVMKSGQFLLLDRLDDEWDEQTAVGRFLQAEQIASTVVVPILHPAGPTGGQAARALGVLLVYTPGQRQPFPGQGMSQEVAKLQSLASQAATAISNAMLYHDLHEALERQQEVDRLKDEFILTISHEFRTPLTTIDGYVSLLDRFRDKVDAGKIAQFTEEIRLASQQLAGMIQMLSDAAGLSDQSLKVAMEAVNLHDIAAKRALSTQTPEAKARVIVRIPEQLMVHADAERLSLIFSNLVGNALKYAPNGLIEVTARVESRETLARQGRKHTADPGAAPKWAVISVRDHGPGIAPEDLDKLFQKFVRLQKSLTTNVRGTGLGLWICREYVEAMGGDIWVVSQVNQGADFQFCLPLDVTVGGKSGR